MANLMIGYKDYSQVSESYTPAFSGGSWNNLPLTNLQNASLSLKARSTNALATSTKFYLDLGVARPVRLVSLLRHNAGAAATVRVIGYSDAGYSVQVGNSGTLSMWPEGYPAAESAKRYQKDFHIILTANVTARYWYLEIVDTANLDGYFEMARAIFAPVFQPATNMDWGVTLGLETDTTKVRTKGGTDYFDPADPRRIAQFSLSVLTESEAFSSVFDIQWDRGIHKEVLFIFDPADTGIMLKRRAYLGRLRELSPIEFPYYGTNKAGFAIEEVL